MSLPHDPYSRLHYRRVIAWPKRIEREWPLIEETLSQGPSPRRVLDLGCGTGEHARFLAAHGFATVGVDRSESLVAEARAEPPPEDAAEIRFVVGDLARLDTLLDPGERFSGAICLGNTLPHLRRREDVEGFTEALRQRLLPGAALLLQIVNYERIFSRRVRHLPLNFRPDEEPDGELVFLRLMELGEDGEVVFCPTTLRFRPSAESPVEVVSSRRVELRGWRLDELDEVFRGAGFTEVEAKGGFGGEPFDAESSADLVLVVR